ncbi:MAG: hypothetical protein AAGH76_15080 [Pseudomonadota bacterium]
MGRKRSLSRRMSVAEFDNGYWYAADLKAFATKLGLTGAAALRKDQVEARVRRFLETGAFPDSNTQQRAPVSRGDPDPLRMDVRIVRYVSNRATKDFIVTEASRLYGPLPKKSGAWYWLNRWREQHTAAGITYRDLVHRYIELCTTEGRLPQIPSARMNNFISDFLAAKEGTRNEAMAAWQALKKHPGPKTFAAWKKLHL